jgi:hypothetical protein
MKKLEILTRHFESASRAFNAGINKWGREAMIEAICEIHGKDPKAPHTTTELWHDFEDWFEEQPGR